MRVDKKRGVLLFLINHHLSRGEPMPMRIGTEMPSLEGATEWFNATGARAADEAKGRPTLVHFWSVSCGTCKENMPRVQELRDARAGEGMRVIAVHMPR